MIAVVYIYFLSVHTLKNNVLAQQQQQKNKNKN